MKQSKEALIKILPFELKAKLFTVLVCPLNVIISDFVSKSHNLIVLSQDPLAKIYPSGLKVTALTMP